MPQLTAQTAVRRRPVPAAPRRCLPAPLAFDLALALDQDLESHAIQNAPHGGGCQVPGVTNGTRQRVRVAALGIVQAFLGRHERAFERGDDVGQADRGGRPRERVAAARARDSCAPAPRGAAPAAVVRGMARGCPGAGRSRSRARAARRTSERSRPWRARRSRRVARGASAVLWRNSSRCGCQRPVSRGAPQAVGQRAAEAGDRVGEVAREQHVETRPRRVPAARRTAAPPSRRVRPRAHRSRRAPVSGNSAPSSSSARTPDPLACGQRPPRPRPAGARAAARLPDDQHQRRARRVVGGQQARRCLRPRAPDRRRQQALAPSTASIASAASPPGRSSRGGDAVETSTIVDSTPTRRSARRRATASMRPSRSSSTCSAARRAGSTEQIGAGRGDGQPGGREQRQRDRVRGTRTATVSRPAVTSGGTSARFRQDQRQRAGPERFGERRARGVGHGDALRPGRRVAPGARSAGRRRAGPWRRRCPATARASRAWAPRP